MNRKTTRLIILLMAVAIGLASALCLLAAMVVP
jgi:hypothetical protein